MPFFSKVFRSKDGGAVNAKTKSRKQFNEPKLAPAPPPKPRWDDAWSRKDVEPEEIQELLRGCTAELKSRGSNLSHGLKSVYLSTD
jgi:predicted Zn-dependent protease